MWTKNGVPCSKRSTNYWTSFPHPQNEKWQKLNICHKHTYTQAPFPCWYAQIHSNMHKKTSEYEQESTVNFSCEWNSCCANFKTKAKQKAATENFTMVGVFLSAKWQIYAENENYLTVKNEVTTMQLISCVVFGKRNFRMTNIFVWLSCSNWYRERRHKFYDSMYQDHRAWHSCQTAVASNCNRMHDEKCSDSPIGLTAASAINCWYAIS